MAVVLEEDDAGTKGALLENLGETQETLIETAYAKLDEVWQAILEDAIMSCPFDTGTLMSTIRLEEGGTGTEEGIGYTPQGTGEKAISIYDSTIVAGDPNAWNSKKNEPCIYAEWVHDGSYNVRTKKMNEPNPWLEEAIEKHEAELDAAIEDMMNAIGAE